MREIVTVIVAETVTAAESVMRIVIPARAITTPVLNRALIPDRLEIPDADATITNRHTAALSFWLTEGKGNAKLNFGTSQKARRMPRLCIWLERLESEERQIC